MQNPSTSAWLRKVRFWIHRHSVLSQLKIHAWRLDSSTCSHGAYNLALQHHLANLDLHRIEVPVDAHKRVLVLDENHSTQMVRGLSRIEHFAALGCSDRCADWRAYGEPFVKTRRGLIESPKDHTFVDRPAERNGPLVRVNYGRFRGSMWRFIFACFLMGTARKKPEQNNEVAASCSPKG
jgi:DNA polymerase III psi subunit